MQIQGFSGDIDHESSSSDYGSNLLHRRDRREASTEARCIRKENYEGKDNDSKNRPFWSDDSGANPDLFAGEAEEQLAGLRLAQVQLGRLSPEAMARHNTYYEKPLSKNSDKPRSDPWTVETYEEDSELSVGRRGKLVLRTKKSISTVVTSPPTKPLTAREIKEFQLLERRVQRELGAAGRNATPARCQDGEGIFLRSNEAADNATAETFGGDQHHSIDANDPSKVVLNAIAENSGASSPIEKLKGPMSSMVKCVFGAQREDPRKDEGRTANNLPGIYQMLRKKAELLEAEILNFTKVNRKIKTVLKEQDEHAAGLKQEKAAWEQQKASDMEAFQKFRDIQMSKLQKERTKLEQQARITISTLPRKEERRAVDELKATLAQKQEAHCKKEEKWRLTSNRLRQAIKEQSEQIDELRKQIRRLEQQIFLQLDARESPSNANTINFRKIAGIRKGGEGIESRLRDDGTAGGLHLKTPRVNGNDVMIFEGITPSKQVKCNILNTCDEATTVLAQKMKHLEKDVDSWTRFKAYDYESEPVLY